MSDSELMGRNEYARHRKCSPNAVTKAVRDGRIARAVKWEDGQIKAIKWRLADELWTANTDPARAPVPGAPALPRDTGHSPGVQMSAHEAEERLQAALGRAIGDGFVAWAGLLVHSHGIDAERAASMIVDLHQVQAVAISMRIGGDIEKGSALIAGDTDAFLSLDARPELLARIRAAAEAYREDNPPA